MKNIRSSQNICISQDIHWSEQKMMPNYLEVTMKNKQEQYDIRRILNNNSFSLNDSTIPQIFRQFNNNTNNSTTMKIEEPLENIQKHTKSENGLKLIQFERAQPNLQYNKKNKQQKNREAMDNLLKNEFLGRRQLYPQRNNQYNKVLVVQNLNDITVTNKETLFAQLPQKNKKKAFPIESIPDQQNNQPSDLKENIKSIKQASQEICLNNLIVKVTNVKILLPILCCSSTDLESNVVDFIYRPGFDQSLQRNQLTELKLDFEFALKPEVGHTYRIYYRTKNSQNHFVVERLENLS